jgi:hypothetical protein
MDLLVTRRRTHYPSWAAPSDSRAHGRRQVRLPGGRYRFARPSNLDYQPGAQGWKKLPLGIKQRAPYHQRRAFKSVLGMMHPLQSDFKDELYNFSARTKQ